MELFIIKRKRPLRPVQYKIDDMCNKDVDWFIEKRIFVGISDFFPFFQMIFRGAFGLFRQKHPKKNS